MDLFLMIILITTIAGAIGTGIGGLVGVIIGHDSSKIVSLLLSFAGGVMLAVVCFDLIPGALQPETYDETIPFYIVILGVIAGYLLIYLLNYIIDKHTNKEVAHIDKDHPTTADDLDELIHADHLEVHRKQNNNRKSLFIAGIVMALAIALHNVPEGMVIGASYAKDNASILVGDGFIMAVVIGLHNIPEGMAVAVPLVAGGTKKTKAVLITALSGLPTTLGAMIGYSFGMMGPLSLSLSLSFASGAMLYVVFGELLPESILMCKSKLPALFLLIGLLLGLVLVMI